MQPSRQEKPIPENHSHLRPRLLDWPAAGALGIGLWLLNETTTIPQALVWAAVILVCVGGIVFVLKGVAAFSGRKADAPGFIYPLAVGLGIAVTLALAEHFVRYLAFPYPLDDGEGFVLNQAVRLASKLPLYPRLGDPPYIITNYPPVFPALLSLFTDPGRVGFFAGRLISVLSTAAIFLSAMGIVRTVTGDRMAGFVAGLLALSSPVIYFWGALCRVDVLATALGMIGLWAAISQKGNKSLWSLPFLLAAVYTRQSTVEAALAIAITFFLNRNLPEGSTRSRKYRWLIFSLAWAIGVAAIFLALQEYSGGEFLKHTVSYTRTQFFPSRIWSAAQWILPSHALLLILALFALPGSLARPDRRMIAYFFSASIATALLSGKVGSDLNYFLNLIVGSACLAGCLVADLGAAARTMASPPRWLPVAMLLIPATIAQSGLLEGNRALSFTPTGEDYASGAAIVKILSEADGQILSEDEGFCLVSGHEVLFNPFIMSELAREGTWDQKPFVDWIRDGGPRLIMLRFDVNDPNNDDRPGAGGNAGWDRFTDDMEEAIKGSYEIDRTVSPIYMRRLWFIYRPKAEQPAA